ncbi:2,4-dienoyl-CoA reductase-like NADH-dependent reductase (Old Yellow Enzyme family) [Peribacillus deserti]|uniref:2,4-dienoyl-CoA reductase-like NADH-dependent reductase (Old Yellow Enzyme family) n=1 Tax=Peribacillus deserti TaxID=673318 RepID=A0ABS2QEL7_9BACI|nr:NADH-dependent flavin oxidoreductase [Peribacillus deserti]MBM7691274.1 2,4-dienoyl-CoA reductase-like NADH-dependent reductase (Old Yellow Enzyme family) [Peribacillus deserti]
MMNTKYEPLFKTFSLPNGVELKNRIVMAPMTNFSSNEDGTVTDQEVNYYVRRSGGVSMVITACTYVTANGKGFRGEFGADHDEMIPSLRQLAQAIKAQGAKAVLQIFHGGRMCPPELVPNGEIVSASAIAAEGEGQPVPRELTDQEIEDIIKFFGDTTRRAIEAGFDGVEIHGANGYLIQQFFSPHSNRREDRWGGSLENRLSFPLAVVEEVKKAAATANEPFIVGYRFSPEEPETPGITMADTLKLVDVLSEQGLDYLHISLQDFTSVPRRGVEDARSRLEIVQERAGGKVPIIGVGSILTADDALKAFETGVPLLALGRELIIDPDWVQKVEQGKEDEIVTKIHKDKQQDLVVPDPLWQAIVNTPGWFPGV